MHAYRYRHEVGLDETNVVGNVAFTQHVRWQAHCREHFLADYAPSVLIALLRRELLLVTLSCSMVYYAECYAFDEIEVDMVLRDCSGNRIGMGFDFMRGPQRVACGNQTVACMRHTEDGVVPAEIPDELVSAVAAFL